MEKEQNRVLTLEELVSMSRGEDVWIETTPRLPTAMQMQQHWHYRSESDGQALLAAGIDPQRTLPLTGHTFYGELWRAWLFEPSPADLAANPWPTEAIAEGGTP